MKEKKSIILATTLVMLLCIVTAVYAWTLSGTSNITPGWITMTGTSTSTADVTCPYIYVDNTLYKDDHVAGGSTKEASNVKSVTTTCTGANTLGNQYWQLYGIHKATYNGTTKTSNSFHEVIW